MDPHVEKPCGDSHHANLQSDSEVWSETPMEPAEARRSRLSFSDTYVEILYLPMCRCDNGFSFFNPAVVAVSVNTVASLILVPMFPPLYVDVVE